MGVGLYLTGTFTSQKEGQIAASWLEEVAAWLEANEEEPLVTCRHGENNEELPTLFVQLHPCAEDVELAVSEPGRAHVSAKTSTAGPGYHIFLCHLLHRFGKEFAVDWEDPDEEIGTGDETNYFFTQDADAVREAMLNWLRTVADLVLERLGNDQENLMISMPVGHLYSHQGPIITPMGPRDVPWWQEAADDPRTGTDFFPWWDEGLGASFFLGRALCRMWQDVRWRPPMNDEEGELLLDVHLDLERAYRLDPALPIPWREWHEIIDNLDAFYGYVEYLEGEELQDTIHEKAAQAEDGPPIGYRRHPVQVSLTGGWTIEIPGELAEQWEETGENWSAWFAGRTIWFSSMSFKMQDDTVPTAQQVLDDIKLPQGEVFEHQTERVCAKAVLLPHEEEGRKLWHLQAHTAIAGGIALCNFFFENREDRDWALRIWKSVDHLQEEEIAN